MNSTRQNLFYKRKWLKHVEKISQTAKDLNAKRNMFGEWNLWRNPKRQRNDLEKQQLEKN